MMMQLRTDYRFYLLLGVALLTTTLATAQTVLQPEPSTELEQVAREQTELWEEELALSAKQMALMEKKFIEFAIKKDKVIQSKMREEAKVERLKALQILENKDMRDILTKPQYDRYIMLQKQNVKQQTSEN